MENTKHTFKVLLVGDDGVGKTTFLKKHLTGNFDMKYIPTLGVELHPLDFNTSEGTIIFNVWDCAGQEKFEGLKDGYYIGADIAFVFNDLTNNLTLKNVPNYIKSIQRIKKIPIIQISTKSDLYPGGWNIINRINNVESYYISTKDNIDVNEPFLQAARLLLNKPNLEFLPNVISFPAIISNDENKNEEDNHIDKIRCIEDKIKKLSNSIEILEFDIKFLNLKKEEKRLINLKLELEKSIEN